MSQLVRLTARLLEDVAQGEPLAHTRRLLDEQLASCTDPDEILMALETSGAAPLPRDLDKAMCQRILALGRRSPRVMDRFARLVREEGGSRDQADRLERDAGRAHDDWDPWS